MARELEKIDYHAMADITRIIGDPSGPNGTPDGIGHAGQQGAPPFPHDAVGGGDSVSSLPSTCQAGLVKEALKSHTLRLKRTPEGKRFVYLLDKRRRTQSFLARVNFVPSITAA